MNWRQWRSIAIAVDSGMLALATCPDMSIPALLMHTSLALLLVHAGRASSACAPLTATEFIFDHHEVTILLVDFV